MNAGGGWHDTCILNISSRGLLLQSEAPPVRGTYLEISRGHYSIVAQVVWSKKHRFGVKTQDALRVEAIVSNLELPPPGPGASTVERRSRPRTTLPAPERNRHRGRLIEYGFAFALAGAGALAAAGEVHAVLAAPLERIASTLGG